MSNGQANRVLVLDPGPAVDLASGVGVFDDWVSQAAQRWRAQTLVMSA